MATDYAGALVRLAAARVEGQRHLLFAYVELFPYDIPLPETFRTADKPWTVPDFGGQTTLTVSATAMTVQGALEWYKQAKDGIVNIPGVVPSVRLEANDFDVEPAFGRFCVGGEVPYRAGWHGYPRIHRLVPMTETADDILRLAESPAARAWLLDNLGFDMFDLEEWVGSISLLAPDPLLESVDHYVHGTNADGSERTVVQLRRRRYDNYPSADADALTLVMLQRRAGGWTQAHPHRVDDDGFSIVDHVIPVDEIGYSVACPVRGLLRMQPAGSFIGALHLNIGVVEQEVNVGVAAGGRRKPEKSYLTHRVADVSQTRVGESLAPNGSIRIVQMREARELRMKIASAPQRLFGNPQKAKEEQTEDEIAQGRAEAEAHVAELVSVAQNRVIFVDCDWGVRETQNYAMRVNRIGVPITILASARMNLPFKKTINRGPSVSDAQNATELAKLPSRELVDYLARVKGQMTQTRIDAFIMPGNVDGAAFHDRFLVIDEEVWALGPSFNELGERIGLISRVHYALPVLEAIDAVLKRSTRLAEWSAAEESKLARKPG